MTRAIALIPINVARGGLGLPGRAGDTLAGRSVLTHVVERVARADGVAAVVLVHPHGHAPLDLLGDETFAKPICTFAFDETICDPYQRSRIAARKWSIESWRGGLGGATVYDELLPAGPLAAAARAHNAESVLLVGPDWPLVDPALCARVLQRHLEYPADMQMVFTQAPPGLCGIAAAHSLLEQLAEKQVGFGQLMGYVPTKPQPDPIGLDVCVQIPAEVRSCPGRFVYDTARSARLIEEVFDEADAPSELGDAECVARIARGFAAQPAEDDPLPRFVTVELTPQRAVGGAIAPQHYVDLPRAPMATDLALRIMEQLGECDDICLTLGGLGDAMLHPDWHEIAAAAREAGVFGLAIETDLLVEESVLEDLLTAPLDIITVRLNADTAAMYEKVMGADRFKLVTDNLQSLLVRRAARLNGEQRPGQRPGQLPGAWIVPRMVKTAETIADMETFYDRWVHFAGHAVIEPAMTGRGAAGALMPVQSPVRMAPPRRRPCRQIEQRLTILSDGTAALCDQDWLGDGTIGDVRITPLRDLWSKLRAVRHAQQADRWRDLPLCAGCCEWHRP